MSEDYVKIADLPAIRNELYESFRSKKTRDMHFRKDQIRQLVKCLLENSAEILDAQVLDGKARGEMWLVDIVAVEKEANHVLSHMDKWLAPEKASIDYFLALDSAEIRRDPLGVVFIIGTWNYPLSTSLKPLIGAIAAGNCAIVKFSEVCDNVSRVAEKLLSRYLDPNCYRFVCGAVNEVTAMLSMKWDHIFFTGNGVVGRIVAKAAAANLTPVTLELGGKSPCFIDDTVNMKTVASRLAYAKFLNNGQTCIAADYILIPSALQQSLIEEMKVALGQMYGDLDQLESNKDYARIISERHWDRLDGYLNKSKGRVVLGGRRDKKSRFLAPTIVTDIQPNDSLMQEEIFGPILPVLTCETVDEAIEFINARDKPLAAYLFSTDSNSIEKFKNEVLSGTMTINDTLLQYACSGIPFGGVGESGYGLAHGKQSVLTFSHLKSVLHRSTALESVNKALIYPPFTEQKANLLYGVALWKQRAHSL